MKNTRYAKANIVSSSDSNNNARAKSFRRFCILYTCFLLIILGLAIYTHIVSAKSTEEKFWTQNHNTFGSQVALLDNALITIDAYCRQLTQDNAFLNLAKMEEANQTSFYVQGYSFKNNMSSSLTAYPNLPLTDYFLYLRNTDYVASIRSFRTAALYYAKDYPGGTSSDYEYWRNCVITAGNGTIHFFPGAAANRAADIYLYLIDMNELTYQDIAVTAGFKFDYNKLKSMFDDSLSENSCLIVLDDSGQPVFCFAEDENGQPTDIDYATLSDELSKLSFKDDFSTLNYQSEKMHVTRVSSSFNNWCYYILQPASIAAPAYTWLYIVIYILVTIGGLFLVFLLARNSMQPIIELDDKLQDTITDRDQLQEKIDQQKPMLRSSYVRQLLLGTVSTNLEADYIKEFLEFPKEELNYNVLYIVIYNNENHEDFGQLPPLDDEKAFSIVVDAMGKYLGENPLLWYSTAERTCAVLVSCKASEEDSFIMKMQSLILKLHDYLLEQHSIWLFAGIGCNTNSLMNVWESFQQAQEAVNYATKNYIFLPYEIIAKDSNAFYYPAELSTKLVHFITSGNLPQVLELFNLLHHENIEERSLPVHLLKYLMSDIRNTLLKARFALPSTTDKAELEALDARFDKHLSFKLCEDIAISLTNMFQISEEDTSLVSTIEKYIKENYRDPSLCLNKISDEFHISETYFSHMFKEKTGTNFSTYLENVRMQEAMRLLRESDKNLSELYLLVGYNNVTTFRRAFKKTFGVTPSTIRDNP